MKRGNEKKDIVGSNKAGAFSILIDREESDITFGENEKIKFLGELKDMF
jgi:hypothetical protein